jgi:tRNA-dihydrouridine synthase
MLRYQELVIDPPLILAPMAGVTDRDFRLIVRRIGGVGLVSMEFVSSKAILSGNPKTRELMHFSDEERPLAIQIYGSDVASMAHAAEVVEQMGADVCDINMGCPANKVLKGCAGAALMADLALAEKMIAEVKRRLTIPLTVKFRVGLDRRQAAQLRRAGPDLRGQRRRRRGDARPYRQTDVPWPGRLVRHRPTQGGGVDPGDRQRRRA